LSGFVAAILVPWKQDKFVVAYGVSLSINQQAAGRITGSCRTGLNTVFMVMMQFVAMKMYSI
jgi:hypothetical protein